MKVSTSWGYRLHGYITLLFHWSKPTPAMPWVYWTDNLHIGFNFGIYPFSITITIGPLFFTFVWPMDMRPMKDRE